MRKSLDVCYLVARRRRRELVIKDKIKISTDILANATMIIILYSRPNTETLLKYLKPYEMNCLVRYFSKSYPRMSLIFKDDRIVSVFGRQMRIYFCQRAMVRTILDERMDLFVGWNAGMNAGMRLGKHYVE